MTAATFGARPDVLLLAFSWCLGQCDRHPERFDEASLLWKYKWIISSAPGFPSISRAQIEELLTDMARRFQRFGASNHTIHHKRRKVALLLADWDAAVAADEAMKRSPRDWLSDCAACEADEDVEYFLLRGLDAEAIARAAPILAGRSQCKEVPHRTFARLLLPLLKMGRIREAMACHLQGYPMVAGLPELVDHAGEHLLFLTLTDNLTAAGRLFERHFPVARSAIDALHRFGFYWAGSFFLRRADAAGKPMRLRASLDDRPREGDGLRSVGELHRWLADELAGLADQIDARNGNDHYARKARNLPQLDQWISPHPVPTATE
jgi:hypothetical protein